MDFACREVNTNTGVARGWYVISRKIRSRKTVKFDRPMIFIFIDRFETDLAAVNV